MFLQSLWLLVTYSYNIVLVLFIATHLFVGAIISFLVGMYMGVYLSQNFEVPRINEPRVVWEKLLAFLEKNRKDPKKVSVGNILRPTTMKELVVETCETPESPSKTEAIVVPESNNTSATFVQQGSQTDIHLNTSIQQGLIPVTPNFGKEAGDIADNQNLSSSPINDNITTLILTEPEDPTDPFRTVPFSQIVGATLTLDKDKAISRSTGKLN